METHFAPAGRTAQSELEREIEIVNASTVVASLLDSVSGMLAILNRDRQVLALNHALLQELGIHDPGAALGLRPGEALGCVHSHGEPDGCGTTRFCSTCGAAVAIVSALCENESSERTCALAAERDGKPGDVCFQVRATPIEIDGARFILLFLRDVTVEWDRAALERTFLHDIGNMLGGLTTASALLVSGVEDPELLRIVRRLSSRLSREVALQTCLRSKNGCDFEPFVEQTTSAKVLSEVKDVFASHPVAEHREIQFRDLALGRAVAVDVSLALRVLGNMVTNALEATEEGGAITVWAESDRDGVVDFCVWNAQQVDEHVARRIFQRNFTTKDGDGRGLGTYSMKLLTEHGLGGTVTFTSSRENGTVFRLSVPV